MKDETMITIVAIVTIGCWEAIALHNGVNGALLAMAFAIVGGLAGYEIRGMIKK